MEGGRVRGLEVRLGVMRGLVVVFVWDRSVLLIWWLRGEVGFGWSWKVGVSE